MDSKSILTTLIKTLFFWFSFTAIASAQLIPDKPMSAPLRIDYNGPLIEVTVNDRPARLLYDSGASRLTLFEQSFPELSDRISGEHEAPVFGGTQKATIKETEPVTLKWEGINIERAFVDMVDYTNLIPDTNEAPFFEGILPPIIVRNDKYESIIVFDGPNKIVRHLTPGKKVKFTKPKKFKLRLGQQGTWRVKLPIMLEGDTKKRILDLVVDTGAASGLILNRQKLNLQKNNSGYKNVISGLGGTSEEAYGGRTRFFIGKDSVLVDTSIAETLPFEKDADGFIGWLFLKRFKIAYDFNKGHMLVDRQGGDFTDDKPRQDQFRFEGVPMPDWMGMKILGVGSWQSAGLKSGDILTSINNVRLSSTEMYSVLKNAGDTPKICWRREEVTIETCGRVMNN